MDPDKQKLLMAEWHQDLVRANYFRDDRSTLAPIERYFPRSEQQIAAHFRGRVMKHLSRRGWKLKQIAYIWGIHTSGAFQAMVSDLIEFPSKCLRVRQ